MHYSIGIYPNGSAQETVATAELADRLGFATLWMLDSHLLFLESTVMLGAIAAWTRRIRLGTAVTNPFTRHPAVTARAFATMDQVSGGPAVLGISVGDSALKSIGLPVATVDSGAQARLVHAPLRCVPIYVAATGPRMLHLAGAVAEQFLGARRCD